MRPLWLVPLFAVYGPALNVVGELRYVEIAVLVLLALNFGPALRYLGPWERRLIGLFVLAALAQIVSDSVNDAEVSGTLKRAGTYVVLALLLIGVKWLSRGDPRRMLLILAGYCASWVFILFVGTSGSVGYAVNPWRLGLGFAATVFLCVLLATFNPLQRFGGLAILALAALHVLLESRSVGIVVGLTGILVLVAQIIGQQRPARFSLRLLAAGVVGGAVAVALVMLGTQYAIEHKLFPEELQKKMEEQTANPYGILAAGRPDTIAAIYGVTKAPFLGFGSTNVDPDVYAFYRELGLAAFYGDAEALDGQSALAWSQQWTLGTPSHSHLFGAWVDAGVVAAVCWMAVLFLATYVVMRMALWRHPLAPLAILIALATLWDVLFSPGPHRMDMAIRLMVLCHAAVLIEQADQQARLRRVVSPAYALGEPGQRPDVGSSPSRT